MAQSIILPDASLLLVHKGWAVTRNKKAESTSIYATTGRLNSVTMRARNEGLSSNLAQTSPAFEFVNMTTPPTRNTDTSKRGKNGPKPVRHGPRTAKKERRKTDDISLGAEIPLAHQVMENRSRDRVPRARPSRVHDLYPICPGSATAFYGGGLPFKMNAQFSPLINVYLQEIGLFLYPLNALLTSNPLRDGWYHKALQDRIFLTATLWCAAEHLSGQKSSSWAIVKEKLESDLLRQLRDRIDSEGVPSDATLGAVSCLAMTGTTRGDPALWSVHMRGMKRMVQSRGGAAFIDNSILIKLYRADTDGAVESLSLPYLPPMSRSRPSLNLETFDPTDSSTQLINILDGSEVAGPLVSIFHRMRQLSITLQDASTPGHAPVDPLALEEDTMIIQRELLEILILEPGQDGPNKACILGALLYIKTLTRPLASWPQSSKTLVERLKASLDDCNTRTIMDSTLLLWLSLLGLMTSIKATSERAWFSNLLRDRTVKSVRFLSVWHDIAPNLENMSWVPGIHDGPAKIHWDMMVRDE